MFDSKSLTHDVFLMKISHDVVPVEVAFTKADGRITVNPYDLFGLGDLKGFSKAILDASYQVHGIASKELIIFSKSCDGISEYGLTFNLASAVATLRWLGGDKNSITDKNMEAINREILLS